MIGYAYDDGGRKAAGRKGKTGDCVTRAAAILTRKPYEEVYSLFAEGNQKYRGRRRNQSQRGVRSASNGVPKPVIDRVFAAMGLKKIPFAKGSPRLTYSEAYEKFGNCIVSTTKHVAAIVEGELRDTHDERVYWWKDEFGIPEQRERKAMSIWVKG